MKPEDWQRWGQFTTFKSNAAELLQRELRPHQRIYCSPLVDPYQPAEAEERLMPEILEAMRERQPRVFTLQTRGPLILRDLDALRAIAAGPTTLRVSFSLPTNRDDVLRLYEPRCPAFAERIATIRTLREAGIETYATLAPLLPCDPEALAEAAAEASGRAPIGDPLHVRSVKPHGATTREAALRIAEVQGHTAWLETEFQEEMIARIRRAVPGFETGPRGFARLAV